MGKYTVLLLVAALVAQLSIVSGSLCTNQCDSKYAAASNGNLVTFCATDGNTYTTRQAAFNPIQSISSDCYSVCGLGVVHIGPCGCPNNCHDDAGYGQCVVDKKGKASCVCSAGRGGADCAPVKCPSTCSGHGTCHSRHSDKGGDYCECAPGFTAWDCSVAIPQTLINSPSSSLPFGEYSGVAAPAFAHDKYGDNHPIFNTSVVATINVEVSKDHLNWMMDPANRRSQELKPGKMFFNNGLHDHEEDIHIRIKGLSSRMMPKKSFTIHFKGSWKDATGFALKAPFSDAASITPVLVELMRAMKAPTYRVSLSTLFINGWYYGIQLLCERIDKNFAVSRFDQPDVNLYELGQQWYMPFKGATPDPYIGFAPTNFDGIPIPGITQDEGNGDWNDLTMLHTVLTSPALYQDYLPKHFNVHQWLRILAVDFVTDNFDSYYGTGNNYIFINVNNSKNAAPYWQNVAYDFDAAMHSPSASVAPFFGMTPDQLYSYLMAGITNFGGFVITNIIWVPNPYDVVTMPGRPLGDAIFNLPGTNDTFNEIMSDLLTRVYFNKPGTLQARKSAYYQLARPLIALDRMYTLNNGNSLANYDYTYSNSTAAWLTQRAGYLNSLFVAKGNGNCNEFGVCVCASGYSGPTCATRTH